MAKQVVFETPMELHCSQTPLIVINLKQTFETPMELHCSQTESIVIVSDL